MTKARGPYVRQKAFTQTFVYLYGHKSIQFSAGGLISLWTKLSRLLTVGSHGYLPDFILTAVFSEVQKAFHMCSLSVIAGINGQSLIYIRDSVMSPQLSQSLVLYGLTYLCQSGLDKECQSLQNDPLHQRTPVVLYGL